MKFNLKKGLIAQAQNYSATGNSWPVRVIPDLNDIEDTTLLPLYPNFFYAFNFTYAPNDTVWVLCSDDYETGFILGRDQPPTSGIPVDTEMSQIQDLETTLGVSNSSASDITILRFSNASFHFENSVTGTSGIIYNTGASTIFGSDGSWLFKPTTASDANKGGFSVQGDSQGSVTIQGRVQSETWSSENKVVKGSSAERVGEKVLKSDQGVLLSASGKMSLISGTQDIGVTGDRQALIVGKDSEAIGTGKEVNVATGEYKITVAVGGITLQSSAPLSLTSATAINITAPLVKTPAGFVAPTGSGGLCGLPFCLFTGAPQTGNVLTGV